MAWTAYEPGGRRFESCRARQEMKDLGQKPRSFLISGGTPGVARSRCLPYLGPADRPHVRASAPRGQAGSSGLKRLCEHEVPDRGAGRHDRGGGRRSTCGRRQPRLIEPDPISLHSGRHACASTMFPIVVPAAATDGESGAGGVSRVPGRLAQPRRDAPHLRLRATPPPSEDLRQRPSLGREGNTFVC